MASLFPFSCSPVFAKSLLNRGLLRSFLLPRSFIALEDRSFSQILRTASLSRLRELRQTLRCCRFCSSEAGIVKSQYTVDIPDVSLSEFVMSNFHEHGSDIAVVSCYGPSSYNAYQRKLQLSSINLKLNCLHSLLL